MSSLAVVITTHNRPAGVRRAVASVLSVETAMETRIVVVDDGSDGDVAAELDTLAQDRVKVVHQNDLGLCVARARGALESSSDWISFLDDDDEWLPSWVDLAALVCDEPVTALRAGTVAIASGGAALWTQSGDHIRDDLPVEQGSLYGNLDVQYLAGCWLVRRELYELVGGYLPGLSASHQSELFIRFGAAVREHDLRTRALREPVAKIERRCATRRALSNPKVIYDGTRWILARHAAAFRSDREALANWESIAAVNGALARDPHAAAHARTAVRARPTDARSWARAVVMSTPLRRFGRKDAHVEGGSASNREPLVHAATLRQVAGEPSLADLDVSFLPWGYRENPQASADAEGTPFWQEPSANDVRMQAPVYRLVAREARSGAVSVLDIGCGSGDKLVRYVDPVAGRWWGVDQATAIAEATRRWGSGAPRGRWIAADLADADSWSPLLELSPDVVMCADVIEHLDDPHALLGRLREFAVKGAQVIVSTPDRARLEGRDPLGPPLNHRHVREWSEAEFRLLVESAGFRVAWCRHVLPRSYSPTLLDSKRLIHRALHRRAVPDRRSSMVLSLAVGSDAQRSQRVPRSEQTGASSR